MFALSARASCEGVDVRCFLASRDEREQLFNKVCAALGCLAQYDPMRLRRIKRDLRGIWIASALGNYAEYHHDMGLCVLDQIHVLRKERSAGHIAATIVHEATHARLMAAGFGYAPEQRQRIESVCFRAEIAFASRLPDGEVIIEDVKRQLSADPIVWTDGARFERATARLREQGIPEWLIRWLVRMRKRTGRT